VAAGSRHFVAQNVASAVQSDVEVAGAEGSGDLGWEDPEGVGSRDGVPAVPDGASGADEHDPPRWSCAPSLHVKVVPATQAFVLQRISFLSPLMETEQEHESARSTSVSSSPFSTEQPSVALAKVSKKIIKRYIRSVSRLGFRRPQVVGSLNWQSRTDVLDAFRGRCVGERENFIHHVSHQLVESLAADGAVSRALVRRE
jgi:hypothetical protein